MVLGRFSRIRESILRFSRSWGRISSGELCLADSFVRFPRMAILDIGCGPADILAYLPDVNYWGFDISEAYIERARNASGRGGVFIANNFRSMTSTDCRGSIVALAIGLLHHLDDPVALNVLQLAHQALKPGGRLLTVDPCWIPRRVLSHVFWFGTIADRTCGTREEYEALALKVFKAPKVAVSHQAWIPYTHCIHGVPEVTQPAILHVEAGSE